MTAAPQAPRKHASRAGWLVAGVVSAVLALVGAVLVYRYEPAQDLTPQVRELGRMIKVLNRPPGIARREDIAKARAMLPEKIQTGGVSSDAFTREMEFFLRIVATSDLNGHQPAMAAEFVELLVAYQDSMRRSEIPHYKVKTVPPMPTKIAFGMIPVKTKMGKTLYFWLHQREQEKRNRLRRSNNLQEGIRTSLYNPDLGFHLTKRLFLRNAEKYGLLDEPARARLDAK